MRIEVTEEPLASLAEYARIRTAFEVRRVLDVTEPASSLKSTSLAEFTARVASGLGAAVFGGLLLTERTLDAPYIKNYDDMEGDAPLEWASRFDLSSWGLLFARVDGACVGGATIAFDTPDLHQLEDRRDVAVLWDIRVAPEMRGQGVGDALFRAVVDWAVKRSCTLLVIETQNTNVDACRFYVRNGCYLGSIRRGAYVELPDEVQILWDKTLSS
jgi:GNAT superfamily N-acetyltransferase